MWLHLVGWKSSACRRVYAFDFMIHPGLDVVLQLDVVNLIDGTFDSSFTIRRRMVEMELYSGFTVMQCSVSRFYGSGECVEGESARRTSVRWSSRKLELAHADCSVFENCRPRCFLSLRRCRPSCILTKLRPFSCRR